MKRLGLLAASAMVATPTLAQAPTTPPKLVIAISVDQLSGDLFDTYRPYFTGGMAQLAGGTVFRRGYQSHAATETCPGHSTLMTAWRPTRNGIVANTWINQNATRDDKTIYCAEDESVVGSTSSNYTVSPVHLKAPTLGDLLKKVSPASRNVAVSGKDRSAVMMSGHNADQRWYWSGKGYVTDLKDRPVPAGVTQFKAALDKAMAEPREAMVPPDFCAGKDKEYEVAPGLVVGNGRFARGANDTSAFRSSPDADGAVLALSAALIAEMRLGRGSATDIISIGLAATDYVGHGTGSGGMEMCIQMAALDQQLGSFFSKLDQSGIDYSVVLTADHGGLDIPERLRDKGVSGAARVDKAIVASEVGKRIGNMLGYPGSIILGSGAAGEFWLSNKVKPADRKRAMNMILKAYRDHPQVYAAIPKAQIAAIPIPTGDPKDWDVLQRLRASYDDERGGDFAVVLKPAIMPIAVASKGYSSTHGSPWDYDRRVPIIFWRKGMAANERADYAETVDLMPTLAAQIGLPLGAGTTDGRCLSGVEGIACPN